MINKVTLKNFGPLKDLKWDNLSNINLIVGENSSGKTFLLKAMYSAIKTIENYKRGDEISSASELLANKLHWVFQADSIGDLVNKSSKEHLRFAIDFEKKEFNFSFGKDTVKKINSLENHTERRQSNSIFLPAKEILSLQKLILKNKDLDKEFGFDDTYYDLAQALRIPCTAGRNYKSFKDSREKLESVIDGKVTVDEKSNQWIYKKGNTVFSIGVTAEGIKKISIIDTLLGNRYLDNKSIIFIDELESALHPKSIRQFCEIVYILAKQGIQFFIASHSYFVLKTFYLIALREKFSLPIISLANGGYECDNLKEGLPENEIVLESIRLYHDELDEAFK